MILGVVTNIAYGVAYSYGVLVGPIHNGTGWSPAALDATFSVVLVLGGTGGVFGGRLVDRVGPRPAFLIAAGVGSAGLATASVPSSLPTFALPYALGCGVVSALGFYRITQPADDLAALHLLNEASAGVHGGPLTRDPTFGCLAALAAPHHEPPADPLTGGVGVDARSAPGGVRTANGRGDFAQRLVIGTGGLLRCEASCSSCA